MPLSLLEPNSGNKKLYLDANPASGFAKNDAPFVRLRQSLFNKMYCWHLYAQVKIRESLTITNAVTRFLFRTWKCHLHDLGSSFGRWSAITSANRFDAFQC